MQNNMAGWVEIPVSDLDRAITFYQELFEKPLEKQTVGDSEQAWFPYEPDSYGAGAALVLHSDHVASENGLFVYFTTPSGDLDKDAIKIEELGGTVLKPKAQIGNYGFMVLLKDTEGNKIALHSTQ